LVAQTAEPSSQDSAAADELTGRRGGRLDLADQAPATGRGGFGEPDAAPGLPSPPEPGAPGKPGRLLDTTPSPRTETSPPPLTAQAEQVVGKTKLGLEAPRMQTPAAVPLSGSAGSSGA